MPPIPPAGGRRSPDGDAGPPNGSGPLPNLFGNWARHPSGRSAGWYSPPPAPAARPPAFDAT